MGLHAIKRRIERGDSLDTVFTSSPPIQAERCSISPSTSKYVNESSIYQTGRKYCLTSKPRKDCQAEMVSDVTPNLTTLDDSVILDIGESSSSSPSEHNLHLEDDDYDNEDGVVEKLPHVHHNDWEVRMLAAELEKQERKRGHSLSVNLGDIKHCGRFLRRRRKLSETETEYSETDVEDMSAPMRPRASSLGQFNLRYGIGSGIFKAINIDRDKDKL